MKKILGGVYFLYDKGELVYIGKTNNLFYRIGTHISENIKQFDEWKYQIIDDEVQRTKTEEYLIETYKPKYNKQIVESCVPDYHYLIEGEHTNSIDNMRHYEDLYWNVDANWLCEYIGFECKKEIYDLIAEGFFQNAKCISGEYLLNRKWVMDNWENILLKIIEKRKSNG